MLELIYVDGLLIFNGISYRVVGLEATSDIVVLVTIENDIQHSVVAIGANDVSINGVLQTSADMIIETLSNG